MLHNSSNRIASFFVEKNIICAEQAPIYAYGVELILATILNTVVILSIGIFMGRFLETVLFLLTFAVIRSFAGGYHADTHLKCLLILVAVFLVNMLLLSLIPEKYILVVTISVALAGLLLIFFYAPVDHENKKFDEGEGHKYKIKSRAFALVFTLVACTGQLFFVNSTLFLCISIGLITAAISTAAAIKIKKRKGENT